MACANVLPGFVELWGKSTFRRTWMTKMVLWNLINHRQSTISQYYFPEGIFSYYSTGMVSIFSHIHVLFNMNIQGNTMKQEYCVWILWHCISHLGLICVIGMLTTYFHMPPITRKFRGGDQSAEIRREKLYNMGHLDNHWGVSNHVQPGWLFVQQLIQANNKWNPTALHYLPVVFVCVVMVVVMGFIGHL